MNHKVMQGKHLDFAVKTLRRVLNGAIGPLGRVNRSEARSLAASVYWAASTLYDDQETYFSDAFDMPMSGLLGEIKDSAWAFVKPQCALCASVV